MNNTRQTNLGSDSAPSHFGLLSMLFSLRGRLSLTLFWILGGAINTVYFLGSGFLSSMMSSQSTFVAAIGIAVWVSLVWMCLALLVKRFHDLGWTGWCAILLFFPAAGQALLFLTAGLGRGTRGPNRYGIDPRSIWFPGFIDPPKS